MEDLIKNVHGFCECSGTIQFFMIYNLVILATCTLKERIFTAYLTTIILQKHATNCPVAFGANFITFITHPSIENIELNLVLFLVSKQLIW